MKDHKRDGLLAQPRIAFIDWAANTGYGAACLYEYPTPAGWRERLSGAGLRVVEERTAMDLYPVGLNLLFGRRLQYWAVGEPVRASSSPPDGVA